MVNVTPSRGRLSMPSMPPGRPIATYRTYEQAQRAVDFLSDNRFPVQFVSIVGTDLKMVERVTGRLSYPRVAIAGLLSGAYWGLFLGFIFSLFEDRSLGGTLMSTMALGAGFGVIFALLSYAATGGRRDFTSTSQIVAGQYAVWCADEQAVHAEQMLSNLPDDHRLPSAPAQNTGRSPHVPPPGAFPPPPAGHGQPPQGGYPAPQQGGFPPPPGMFPGQGWQGQGHPGPVQGQQAPQPAANPAGQQAGSHPVGQPPASGPTYSEMIELRKREAREAAAREAASETRPNRD